MAIDFRLIGEITGSAPSWKRSFECLGLVDSAVPGTLTFLDEKRYLRQLAANPNIAGAIVAADLAEPLGAERPDIAVHVSEDPRWDYFSLHNHVAGRDREERPSEVSPEAVVHPTAFVSEVNVSIGPGTRIGPNVTILADVAIGRDCVIHPGTVIGGDGFEFKRTSKGILPVVHDGVVEIGDEVRIGSNCTVDKGFRSRPTVIGARTKLDNLVHVAHSDVIGTDCLLTAGVQLSGSVRVGDRVWLSVNVSVAPGLTIGDDAFVSIGAVVTRNVGHGEQVTGNFAIPHQQFLRAFRKSLRDSSEK